MLRSTGPHDLDLILLSHTDLDQAGGMACFPSYFPSTPSIGPDNCVNGNSWFWDGVRFTTLQAEALIDRQRSFVYVVDGDASAIPLTSAATFRSGLNSAVNPAAHDVAFLLAPHHGSASSSSMPFVRQLAPEVVVYSAGKSKSAMDIHTREWSAVIRVGGITAVEHRGKRRNSMVLGNAKRRSCSTPKDLMRLDWIASLAIRPVPWQRLPGAPFDVTTRSVRLARPSSEMNRFQIDRRDAPGQRSCGTTG